MTDPEISLLPTQRSLLIVDDDKSFLQRLARAMGGRGFTVTTAESVSDDLLQVETAAPAFAVVDMRLGDGNGLDVISAMKKRRPEARAPSFSPATAISRRLARFRRLDFFVVEGL